MRSLGDLLAGCRHWSGPGWIANGCGPSYRWLPVVATPHGALPGARRSASLCGQIRATGKGAIHPEIRRHRDWPQPGPWRWWGIEVPNHCNSASGAALMMKVVSRSVPGCSFMAAHWLTASMRIVTEYCLMRWIHMISLVIEVRMRRC